MHDEFNHFIADKYKVSSIIAKHFENQFQDGVEQGVNMFEGPPKSLDSPIGPVNLARENEAGDNINMIPIVCSRLRI